ncbi:MAG: hypothetical protein ABIS69_06615 [Sediminibacterium sp.]
MIENHITASCRIFNNSIRKNGQLLFAKEGEDVITFLVSVYKEFANGYARFYKMDNLSKLGWLASEILLKDDFDVKKYNAEEVGIVLANANSSLDTDMKYSATIADIPSPSVFVYTLPNIVTGEICIRNHFKGENAFFISEDFDAGFIQQYVNNLLNHGVLNACICGWVELLGDKYKAVLFLVEKQQSKNSLLFNEANMNQIFNAGEIV